MHVHDALMSRHSCRRFKPDPVADATLRKILTAAGQAPSGHNTQPWKVYVVQGATKARITDKAMAVSAGRTSMKASDPEFNYYPTEWFEPYLSRRRATGFGLYGALGIGRDDKQARTDQMNRNYQFFDAPVGMFVTFSPVDSGRRSRRGTAHLWSGCMVRSSQNAACRAWHRRRRTAGLRHLDRLCR